MSKRLLTLQAAWPIMALIGLFIAVFATLGDFRFSDPDQYFHYTVAREWAQSWSFWTLPQVTGIGWDHYFNDKEFLFHIAATLAYLPFGDSGVIAICALAALCVVVLVYKIAERLTNNSYFGLFAAASLFLSDTFVMHMMLVRAYIFALALTLLIVYCLIENKKRTLLICCFFFSWTYHAIYIPLFILFLNLIVEYFDKKEIKTTLLAIAAVVAGSIIHPHFPSNYSMTLLGLQIVADQLHLTDLPFGDEQQPFRTNNLLLVFRFPFLFLLLTASVLWFNFAQRCNIEKPQGKAANAFLFFSLLSVAFFILLFISPRIQIYFIPIASITGTLALHCFTNKRVIFISTTALLVLLFGLSWPYKHFRNSVEHFKAFDHSYLDTSQRAAKGARILNCEWWGGNYTMYANPDAKVMDVLDPELLLTRDIQLFETVTQLRLAKVIDPYYMIGSILKYDHVLCSSKTPLDQQIKHDPRFEVVSQTINSFGSLTLYRLQSEDIYGLKSFEIQTPTKTWVPHSTTNGLPLSVYLSELSAKACTTIRPTQSAPSPLLSKNYFILSGTGIVTVFKDNRLYLDATPLSNESLWAKIILPLESQESEYAFRICPEKLHMPIALGIFLLTTQQKESWCKTNTLKSEALFSVHNNFCKSLAATPAK